jgi:hypothetical protein
MMLTKREHSVLRPAIVFRWDIEYDSRGIARWNGYTSCRINAHVTIQGLIDKGLMERIVGNTVRATTKAHEYRCQAPGCYKGGLYKEDESTGQDQRTGDCPVCAGSGLRMTPRHT